MTDRAYDQLDWAIIAMSALAFAAMLRWMR